MYANELLKTYEIGVSLSADNVAEWRYRLILKHFQ